MAVPATGAPGHASGAKIFNDLFLSPDEKAPAIPAVNSCQWLVDGKLEAWTGATTPVFAPIFRSDTGTPVQLGVSPMMKEKDALLALDAARKAYNSGRGAWPTAAASVRIAALEKFTAGLQARRNDIAALLMWEICKVQADAEKEVDRTIVYIKDTIKEFKSLENRESTFMSEQGIFAQVRRAPLGVVLCLGPFNYPFNETYATLIPALLMGNTCVMKLPRVGVLCHAPTLELFRDCFPAGVVNVIAGSGRETMPPLMKTGHVDVFAFIGTSSAADALQKAHPKPHRLRVCLGLEAKNPAIVLPDADLNTAVDECVLGSLSFNGQRCTAIKIIFVHKSLADKFVEAFSKKVDALPMGLPWRAGVKITPLPEEAKPGYLHELVQDAIGKGAHIANIARGGKADRTLVAPTVLYPVSDKMRCYHEEQFGPVIPIAPFEHIDEVYAYLAESNYGQQAAVFSQDAQAVAPLLDVLVNQVSRVNLNCQCQRGPDSFPFTARKDSAYGTLSIPDALRVFSIRSLVASKHEPKNQELVNQIVSSRSSNFLRLDYLF